MPATGYMTAAVRAWSRSLRHPAAAPAGSGLHPDQHRLDPALENTGFLREGYARQYLCINGIWQDHLLYARIKEVSPP